MEGHDLNRRRYLASLSTIGAVSITGCQDDPRNRSLKTVSSEEETEGTPDSTEENEDYSKFEDIKISTSFPEKAPKGGTLPSVIWVANEGDELVEYELDVRANGELITTIQGEVASTGGGETSENHEFLIPLEYNDEVSVEFGPKTAMIELVEPDRSSPLIDPANRNHQAHSFGPVNPTSTDWVVDDGCISSPAINAGDVFVCHSFDERIHLVRYDLDSGEQEWSLDLAEWDPSFDAQVPIPFEMDEYVTGPFVGDEVIFVVANDLYAVEKSGDLRWKFDIDPVIWWGVHHNEPLILRDQVIATSVGDGIYGLDKESGDEIWHNEEAFADSRPSADADHIYCVGREGNKVGEDVFIRALDRENGESIWKYNTNLEEYIYEEREHRWHSALHFTAPTVFQDEVHIGTAHNHDDNSEAVDGGPNRHLISLNRKTGEEQSVISTGHDFNPHGHLVPYFPLGIQQLIADEYLRVFRTDMEYLIKLSGQLVSFTELDGDGTLVSTAQGIYNLTDKSVKLNSSWLEPIEIEVDEEYGRSVNTEMAVADGVIALGGPEKLIVISE